MTEQLRSSFLALKRAEENCPGEEGQPGNGVGPRQILHNQLLKEWVRSFYVNVMKIMFLRKINRELRILDTSGTTVD